MLLRELTGIPIGVKQIERVSEALGKDISRDEKLFKAGTEISPITTTMYLGLDGTGIPMRDQLPIVPLSRVLFHPRARINFQILLSV